jgi:hypothetical protein
MNLVYYHPIALTNKLAFHQCINPLISVMDRTKNHWPNFEYKNLFPMPSLPDSAPNFIKLSHERAKQLTTNDKHIKILWSGGIDSTFIMTVLIESGILDDLHKAGRLTIGLNQDSIKEYPEFFEKYIKNSYLDCTVQADEILSKPEKNEIIITGEMADNLVGSLTMKSCVDYYNDFSTIFKDKEVAIKWLGRNLDTNDQNSLREFIEQVCSNSPVELKTCHDLLWYLNFNFKWQAVNFRIVSHAPDSATGNQLIANLHHFFNTIEFQHWSMLEGHHFAGSSWRDYKMVMKKQIYTVTGHGDYFKYKTKWPSLPSLLRYKDTYDFIYDLENGSYRFSKEPLRPL